MKKAGAAALAGTGGDPVCGVLRPGLDRHGHGANTVRVAETGNEANQIRVSYDAGTDVYLVADAASMLTPSGTCTMVDEHSATCPGAGIKTIIVADG